MRLRLYRELADLPDNARLVCWDTAIAAAHNLRIPFNVADVVWQGAGLVRINFKSLVYPPSIYGYTGLVKITSLETGAKDLFVLVKTTTYTKAPTRTDIIGCYSTQEDANTIKSRFVELEANGTVISTYRVIPTPFYD